MATRTAPVVTKEELDQVDAVIDAAAEQARNLRVTSAALEMFIEMMKKERERLRARIERERRDDA